MAIYPSAYSALQCFAEDFGQTDQAVNNFLKEIFADVPNFQTKARPLQHGLRFLATSNKCRGSL